MKMHPASKPVWYLQPSALAIIVAIRENPPQRVVKRYRNYTTTDEWQVFEGDDVDALRCAYRATFERIDATGDDAALHAFVRSGSVQDVIAAAVGCPLPGTHFTDDRPRLNDIASAINAALAPAKRRRHD